MGLDLFLATFILLTVLHGSIPLGIFEETVRKNCQFFSHIATLADGLLQKSFHDIPAKPLASLC